MPLPPSPQQLIFSACRKASQNLSQQSPGQRISGQQTPGVLSYPGTIQGFSSPLVLNTTETPQTTQNINQETTRQTTPEGSGGTHTLSHSEVWTTSDRGHPGLSELERLWRHPLAGGGDVRVHTKTNSYTVHRRILISHSSWFRDNLPPPREVSFQTSCKLNFLVDNLQDGSTVDIWLMSYAPDTVGWCLRFMYCHSQFITALVATSKLTRIT